MTKALRRPIAPTAPRMAGLTQLLATFARVGFLHMTRELAGQVAAQPAPLWISLPEAAEYTGLSVPYLKRLIASRKLPATRDRSLKVRRTDLDRLDGLEQLAASSRKLNAAARELRERVKRG